MKAYELIENMPNQMNGFKKVIFENLKEEYPFELNSVEENSFYKTLMKGYDDKRFIWYESDKKAYLLYVTLNEDGDVEFNIREMDVLWKDEFGEAEYDMLCDMPGIFDCFEDAVVDFINFLERI